MILKILIVTYDENGNQLRERYVVDAFQKHDNKLMFIDLDVDGIVPEGYKHITLEELGNLLI